MIVSGLGDLTGHLELAPGQLVGIKLVAVITITVIQNPSKNDCLVIKNCCLVVRNLAGHGALLVDALPLHGGVAMNREFVELAQRNPPHRLYWAHFDVSAAVNVQTEK